MKSNPVKKVLYDTKFVNDVLPTWYDSFFNVVIGHFIGSSIIAHFRDSSQIYQAKKPLLDEIWCCSLFFWHNTIAIYKRNGNYIRDYYSINLCERHILSFSRTENRISETLKLLTGSTSRFISEKSRDWLIKTKP